MGTCRSIIERRSYVLNGQKIWVFRSLRQGRRTWVEFLVKHRSDGPAKHRGISGCFMAMDSPESGFRNVAARRSVRRSSPRCFLTGVYGVPVRTVSAAEKRGWAGVHQREHFKYRAG